jgi:precorrin-6B methylase 2
VPYVPTPYRIIDKMIALANLKPGEKVVDLGSGSGRIVLRAAKKHQGEVWGLEKSKLLLTVSRWRSPFNRKKAKVVFNSADIFDYDLSSFDVVFCFLTSLGMKKLENSFLTLKPGAKIVSYMFPLSNPKNFSEQMVSWGKKDKIFIYTKKA